MNRRDILKAMATVGGTAGMGLRLPMAHAAEYTGKFLVSVQADGGWDPTSFCDPKENTEHRIINHWAEDDETQRAGNIAYAPFAENKAFFDEYHRRMLVINGVDAQTNSHTVGVVHNWSGRNADGYPTTTALLAAHATDAERSPDMPVPYLSFGGYSETADVTRYTRMNNPDVLHNIALPAVTGDQRFVSEEDWAALETYGQRAIERLLEERDTLLPLDDRNRLAYQSAFANSEGLKAYADALADEEIVDWEQSGDLESGNNFGSDLKRQAQLAVLAFKTGVSVSADLFLGGFDTHAWHDIDHAWLLGNLTQGVDYLWIEAAKHGIADRLVVVIGSDFSRTNHYNADNGKDHWPIGSFVVMVGEQQPWTHRAVGETNKDHEANRINPTTLEVADDDDPEGTIIYPAHVHTALRRYLGIDYYTVEFPFQRAEHFTFFQSPA